MQEKVDLICLYPGYCLCDGYQAFINHVDRDSYLGLRCTFAITCLQQPELTLFNGKFHVLHIAVVFFKPAGDLFQLGMHFRHIPAQSPDGQRGSGSGNNIFTLRIDQVITFKRRRTIGCIS